MFTFKILYTTLAGADAEIELALSHIQDLRDAGVRLHDAGNCIRDTFLWTKVIDGNVTYIYQSYGCPDVWKTPKNVRI